MKKKFWFYAVFVMVNVLFFACKDEEEVFKTSWDAVSVQSLETYNDNCKVVNDSEEGELFYSYSLFDKNIQPDNINNVTFKNIGFNNCGFEGKFKYISGPLVLYGFLLNVDLDENSFYLLAITKNGGFELYYYSGDTSKPSKGALEEIAKELSSASPIKGDGLNTIKVNTVSEDKIEISFNDTKVYTLKNPKNKRGAIGIFQMLDDSQKQNFKSSNPMVSYYQLNRLQKY